MAEARLTLHVARAALHVAATLGQTSTPVAVARESYRRRATGGIFSVVDLIRAEDTLVSAGFIVRSGDALMLTPLMDTLVDANEDDAIEVLAAAVLGCEAPTDDSERTELGVTLKELVDDPARREALLLALGRRWDDQRCREVGEIGEELVTASARDELAALGRPDLARAVRRVSLISDQLGYDVVAPRVGAAPRLLEVKATARADESRVFLSRAEAEAGSRFGDWALVVCCVHDVVLRTGEIVGWCQYADLEKLLPVDVPGGRWQSVAIEFERLDLQLGLPRPSG
jgi:Domain of unknown function (DUF3883)